MPSNYDKMEQLARSLFLQQDQEQIIRRWDLRCDRENIYLRLFSDPLKLNRKTAVLSPDGEGYPMRSTVNESMILFDILTRSPERPRAAGVWTSISGLGGIIGASHDRTLSHNKEAALFTGGTERLRNACERLGGVPCGKADVGYVIPVFADFSVLFQFWDADEEFPAQIKYHFDANALLFMHYETLWYVMSGVMDRLRRLFGQ